MLVAYQAKEPAAQVQAAATKLKKMAIQDPYLSARGAPSEVSILSWPYTALGVITVGQGGWDSQGAPRLCTAWVISAPAYKEDREGGGGGDRRRLMKGGGGGRRRRLMGDGEERPPKPRPGAVVMTAAHW